MQVTDEMVEVAAEAMKQRRRNEIEHGAERATYEEMATLAPTAALEAMWRPIEEAPKSRGVLLFSVTDVAEDGTVKNWKMGSGFFHEGYNAWSWEGQIVKSYNPQPTHFMPLPLPPTREA